VPGTRPRGESLYNVVVIAAEHELGDNPDFRLPDDADDFNVADYAAGIGPRAFKMKTKEAFHERTVFAPDAAEACERATDVVMWDAGASASEWWVEAVVPV
jgi:hypothetical protein